MNKTKEKSSKDGWVLEQIEMPTDVETKIKFTVKVTDKENKEDEKSVEIDVGAQKESSD